MVSDFIHSLNKNENTLLDLDAFNKIVHLGCLNPLISCLVVVCAFYNILWVLLVIAAGYYCYTYLVLHTMYLYSLHTVQSASHSTHDLGNNVCKLAKMVTWPDELVLENSLL